MLQCSTPSLLLIRMIKARGVRQCVAVCCIVWQRVAVLFAVAASDHNDPVKVCVAVCGSVLQGEMDELQWKCLTMHIDCS